MRKQWWRRCNEEDYSVSITLLQLVLGGQKSEMKLKHSETIQRTFAAPKALDVDNISGSVHVIGYSGQQVELTAVRTNEADTQELLDKAAKEVTLKTEEKDGELMIYPDGPFRDRNPPFRGSHDHDGNPGYRFTFEMTIKVPDSTESECAERQSRRYSRSRMCAATSTCRKSTVA